MSAEPDNEYFTDGIVDEPGKDGEKTEPNLELARYSIDMLELLAVKTEGNLEAEEKKFLEEIIHQLRLKYLEVAKEAQ